MKNFAIMRHAAVDNSEAITPESREVLIRVGRELADKIGGTVRIFHSQYERARLTAHSLADILNGHDNISANVVGDIGWLNCDHGWVNDDNIAHELVDGTFAVFVTHQPDMRRYLGQHDVEMSVTNCALYSPEFIIPGH